MSARSTFRRIPVVGQVERSTYVVYVGFLLIFAVFAVLLRDEGFLTVSNLLNIVLETTPVTVMAVGMVFVLSAGEIDLSIGSVVAIAALLAAVVMRACLPLMKQAKLMGVLYLENKLAPRVFTPKRLTMLDLMASQAAISLDHARLYAGLGRLNAELTKENSDRKKAEEA